MIRSDSAGEPSRFSMIVDISPNSSMMTCNFLISVISFSLVPSHLTFSAGSCSYGVAGESPLSRLTDDDIGGSSDTLDDSSGIAGSRSVVLSGGSEGWGGLVNLPSSGCSSSESDPDASLSPRAV
jgi:hypothetical protein